MSEDNFNPDTVGTAVPFNPEATLHGVRFGMCIAALEAGHMIGCVDSGRYGKSYIFKQVPSKVPAHVVPKMSSLPDTVKDALRGHTWDLTYRHQLAIINYETGVIDSFTPTVTDLFEPYWYLVE